MAETRAPRLTAAAVTRIARRTTAGQAGRRFRTETADTDRFKVTLVETGPLAADTRLLTEVRDLIRAEGHRAEVDRDNTGRLTVYVLAATTTDATTTDATTAPGKDA